jgi:hypothetical protein
VGVVVGTVQHGPAAAWDAVKTELRGADVLGKVRQWGDKVGARVDDASPAAAITDLARRADAERETLARELRLAWAGINSSLRDRLPARHSLELQRSFSRGPDGVELRRISLELLAAAQSGATTLSPEAARQLAAAAAARGSVLHAELLLWLVAIRRLAVRSRQARRR